MSKKKHKKNKTTLQQVKHFILCLDQNNMERLLASMPVCLWYNFKIYFLIHFSIMSWVFATSIKERICMKSNEA